MDASQSAPPASNSTGKPFGTRGYRGYVLFALTLAFTLNFIDRILIQILSEPIINEFSLTDFQFGLLSGFGFALFYTIAGIPIARLAERSNRVRIIAVSIIIWSIMTALCGIAGSFAALLLFRIGVSIGEAGLTPPANSLIADYFPPRSRARAIAIYAMGVTLGSVSAAVYGGPVAQALSWRAAFLILGIPGVIIGLIIWFSIKEPPRGYSDPLGTPRLEPTGFAKTIAMLSRNKSFWVNILGATIIAFVGYGIIAFQASFLIRNYQLSLAEAATKFIVPLGLAAALGTFLAGYLTEKISGRYANAVAWIPAIGLILSVPFYWLGFGSENPQIALILLLIAAAVQYSYLGAQFTICQAVVGAQSRATATAIMLFVINLIGYGAGPLTVGLLSDYFAAQMLASSPFGDMMHLSMCKGESASLLQNLGAEKAAYCAQASAAGLRKSMQLISLGFIFAGAVFFWTSKILHKDLIAKMS